MSGHKLHGGCHVPVHPSDGHHKTFIPYRILTQLSTSVISYTLGSGYIYTTTTLLFHPAMATCASHRGLYTLPFLPLLPCTKL